MTLFASQSNARTFDYQVCRNILDLKLELLLTASSQAGDIGKEDLVLIGRWRTYG